jgi:hypothetical protein
MKLSQFLCVAVGIVKLGALFASDLLLETIGYVDKQVIHQNCLLVTSTYNAACINKASGEINWKFSLPSQSVERHIAYSNEEAFILSKIIVNDKQFYTVQALLLSNGFFSWDFSLPYLRRDDELLEYYYDDRINVIKFIFESSVIVLELGKDRNYYMWTQSDDGMKRFRLKNVINSNSKENGAIALGCNAGVGNDCESFFTISFDLFSKRFSISQFGGNAFGGKFPTALSSKTLGTILYDAELIFSNNKDNCWLAISVLESGQKQPIQGKVAINTPTVEDINFHIHTFVSKDSFGELKPLIVVNGVSADSNINFIAVIETTYTNDLWTFTEVYSNHSTQKMVVSKQLFSSTSMVAANWKICHIDSSQSKFSISASAPKVISLHLPEALHSSMQPDVLLDLNPNSIFIFLSSGIMINAVHHPISSEWKLNWSRNEGLGNLHDVFVVNPEEPETIEKMKVG